MCKSVLVRIYVMAFGICCFFGFVVSKYVESICLWFVFLSCCCGLIVVLGVKASLTLGGKKSLGVKGLVGLAIEVEKTLPCVERVLL